MLALTKKTGYALVAMAYLADRDDDQPCPAREIAERLGVPNALLMNVLKQLAAEGYVVSQRGAQGGYRLACDLDQTSLADVIESMEGPVRLAECITLDARENDCSCRLADACPIADPIHRAHSKLTEFLRDVPLSDVIRQPAFTGVRTHHG